MRQIDERHPAGKEREKSEVLRCLQLRLGREVHPGNLFHCLNTKGAFSRFLLSQVEVCKRREAVGRRQFLTDSSVIDGPETTEVTVHRICFQMSQCQKPVIEPVYHTRGYRVKRKFVGPPKPQQPVGGSAVKIGGRIFARLAFTFHQRIGVGEEGCCHKHNNKYILA